MKAIVKKTPKQSSNNRNIPQRGVFPSFFANWPLDFYTEEFDRAFDLSVDVSEKKDSFEIKANIPGIDPERVNVEVNGSTISISGETGKEEKIEEENFYRIERLSGSIYRSFELPNTADFGKIECNAKNGVLYIAIPKKAESKGKKIKVNIK